VGGITCDDPILGVLQSDVREKPYYPKKIEFNTDTIIFDDCTLPDEEKAPHNNFFHYYHS
jgi:hypothetical protein